MSAQKAPNLNNYFSAAKQSQQLSAAEEEIQRLKAEIEELRNSGSIELEAQLEALREQLESRAGVVSISLEQIQPNPEQPRQTFLPESISSMSRSLSKDGQLEPIILVERGDLVLFDGERRWRSAKNLGWQSLQAVIIPEPTALHRKALLTSLHREDLNPLDKAEAIVRELADNTGIDAVDIPRLLSTVVRRLNKQGRMGQVVELMSAAEPEQKQGLASLGLDEQEQAILWLLLDLQLNPASIDANIFPHAFFSCRSQSCYQGIGTFWGSCTGTTEALSQKLEVVRAKSQVNQGQDNPKSAHREIVCLPNSKIS